MDIKTQSSEAMDRFLDAWGAFGALFGFSRSTARVSALLMISTEPLSLSEIADRLQMSRGNASMCLKELRTWGVARRVTQPGERQDFYVADGEIWNMAVEIMRERKRRVFDPTLHEALLGLEGLKHDAHAPRAQEIEEFLRMLDRASSQVLAQQDALRSLLRMFGEEQK
jgi:DNA-binding transcriptional regulator GbsR (MarR family)